MTERILRLPAVIARTGLSKATIYRTVGRTFPAPRRLTERSVGWLESEIEAWLASRPNPGVSTGVSTGSEAA